VGSSANQPGLRNWGEGYYSFWRAKGEDRAGEGIVFSRIRKSNFPVLGWSVAEAFQCILLDDPLAAVDMHTAQRLVNALSGPLCKDRTIILVTHHISLCLPISSFLVVLFQGSVRRLGTIEELRKSGYLKELIERDDLAPEAYQPAHEFPGASSKQKATPDDEPNTLARTPPEREGSPPIINQEQSRKKGKLVDAEKRAEGRVSYRTYWTYIRAAGVWTWMVTVFLMIFIRLVTVANQVRGVGFSRVRY